MMKTFAKKPAPVDTPSAKTPSQLMQWPVQIKLVPVNAPYFDGADLLVAADCTAYAAEAPFRFHDRQNNRHRLSEA